MAARTTRKHLTDGCASAQLALDRLNVILYQMVQTAAGRSDPITKMAPILADGKDTLSMLWKALRDQL